MPNFRCRSALSATTLTIRWPPIERAFQFIPFTPPFNLSGQPAINVPVEWTDAGLPVGVQLVAGYGREDVLLQVASQLESAKPWAHRTPQV